MSALENIYGLRNHINSDAYKMTCCTISEAIGDLYVLAIYQRGLGRKISGWREFKFWLVCRLIRGLSH
jgi:hypothetical protein